MKKRFYLPGILALLLALYTEYAFAAVARTPDIKLNATSIETKAYVEGGYLYLPVRTISESLGYDVGWSQKYQTMAIGLTGKNILLNFKEGKIKINDHEYYMTDSLRTIKGKTYMRADFFSDNFALKVQWDRSQGKVMLNSIRENDISINTIKEASEDSALKITLQYPQIEGLKNKQVEEDANALFKNSAENAAKAGKKNAADLAEYAKLYGGGSPNPCETYFNYQIKYNQNNIMSVVFLDYQYAGGAHGITVQTAYTINLKIGNHYTLKDLFKKNADYVSVISKTVKTQLEERNLTSALFAPFIKISGNQYYYLSNSGVVVYFQDYDILPYAAGIQEFSTDFSALDKLLVPLE